MAAKYPPIQEPTTDPQSLRDSVLSLKQGFELLSHQRNNPLVAAVTWADLLALGIITAAQVPKK
jgi:hypothetical protein